MTNLILSAERPPPRAITFSEYSELVYIPCDPDDKCIKWYSSDDSRRFRKTMVDDIRRLSHEIDVLPRGDILTQDQLCKCLGIDAFLCKNDAAIRRAGQSRRAHIAAVLSEQWTQKQNGKCDVARLSSISQNSSRRTVEKARKLAMGYAALLIE